MADQRQLADLELLLSIADRVQGRDPMDLVQREALSALCCAADAGHGVLLLLEDGLMRIAAAVAVSSECANGLEGFAPWPAGARGAEPVVVDAVAEDPRAAVIRDVLVSAGIQSMACIPLLHHGGLVGEILLLREEARPFGARAVRLALAAALYLAFAVWREWTETDRVELLRRLEADRSVLESLVNQMPAGVLLADVPSGRVVLSNPQVSAIWRRPVENAASLSDYREWGGLDERGAPLPPSAWPLARSVTRGETVRGEDVAIRRGDGSVGIAHMSSTAVRDSQGRQLAAVATLYDVTEERAEDERRAFLEEATRTLHGSLEARSVLQSLTELLVGRYADWCVAYCVTRNGGMERVAAAHADPACGEMVAPLTSGSVDMTAEHAVSVALRERSPVTVGEGDDLPLEAAADERASRATLAALAARSGLTFPLLARDRALGAVTLVRSGGRYREAERDFLGEVAWRAALALDNALLYEQARTADQAKSSFLAVVSHEFRTPLSAILGYTDILTAEVHGTLNAKQRGHLHRVKASVRHLSYLVDEILTFASMEAGRERFRPADAELVALVGDMAELVRPMADAAGLALRVDLPDGPLQLRTDPPKVRQILINLLSNAVKYTRQGHVELTLEADEARVFCRVRDTGPGIAEENRENVFEPYWQVDGGVGARIAGTGLGLAVARRLARLLGGDVHLHSELGQGSTFTLDLPRTPPSRVDPAPSP